MRTIRCKTAITLAVGLLFATGGVTQAMPTFGISSCVSCHDTPGGNLTISPDPLEIVIDDSGLLTFNVISLPAASNAAISLTGLDAAGLDATIGAGWTAGAGFYYSDFFSSPGPVTLDLGIGPVGIDGDYPIGVQYVGHNADSGKWGGTYDFTTRVLANIPEPSSVLLLSLGCITLAHGIRWRRRKAS